MLTLYMFYGLLTLVTVPLVMHEMSRESARAGRKYLYYSLGGAAFAFIGMVFLIVYGMTLDFRPGGVLLAGHTGDRQMMLLIYVMTFFGFAVKAAIFPFHALAACGIGSPTPVTALLHAVAVVKSGACAVLRLTYFSFGASYLFGTWGRKTVMAGALVTIAYASTRALKETHFKRRLAYSTVNNLSYVLFAATLMTPFGLAAALCHTLVSCGHQNRRVLLRRCGHASIRTGVYLSARWDWTQDALCVYLLHRFSHCAAGDSAACGFPQQVEYCICCNRSYQPLARFGVLVLLYSALMTAIYMLTIVVRAWSPCKEDALQGVRDPNWYMKLPLALFAAGVIVLGLCGGPVVQLLQQIAYGNW